MKKRIITLLLLGILLISTSGCLTEVYIKDNGQTFPVIATYDNEKLTVIDPFNRAYYFDVQSTKKIIEAIKKERLKNEEE